MADIPLLANKLEVRAPPITNDLRAVADLLLTCDIAESGEPDTSEEDVLASWQETHFNLATDAWVVTTADGGIFAYARVQDNVHGRLFAQVRVHPEYSGQGIGSYLLSLAEKRAQDFVDHVPAGVRVTLNNWIIGTNEKARALLEREGYVYARTQWGMAIEMDAVPTQPDWPTGIAVRSSVPDQDDRKVFDAVEEAFSDHWGYVPKDFEGWKKSRMEQENFDPSLWFLAFDGERLAGVSLCENFLDMGSLNNLAVRRAWRGKGLGMALLRYTFCEFYRRGKRKVILGVDSASLTGATRLYERAGMHVDMRFDLYQKELRPGRELSTQSIAE